MVNYVGVPFSWLWERHFLSLAAVDGTGGASSMCRAGEQKTQEPRPAPVGSTININEEFDAASPFYAVRGWTNIREVPCRIPVAAPTPWLPAARPRAEDAGRTPRCGEGRPRDRVRGCRTRGQGWNHSCTVRVPVIPSISTEALPPSATRDLTSPFFFIFAARVASLKWRYLAED
jgi:hypothetical protein